MNRRNHDFVNRYNRHADIRRVNDKLATKQLAIAHGIPVPEHYDTIEYESQLDQLATILSHHQDFVIKPDRGTGGKGILIISETIKNKFRKISGQILDLTQLETHFLSILSGVYSMGGYRDKALIEYRVKCTSLFDKICYNGVPDLRILVFQGFPIMAMARLPTIKSDGKANLHQGAIGVGISITQGLTTTGVMGNEFITEHPDTLNPITDLQIPHWEQLLEFAARCYELTNLGYFGVDIVIDQTLGPLLLELNAHPGLNIQIANNDGIGRRTDLLLPHTDKNLSPGERIQIVKQVLA